jgi:hypothetical protein
MVFEGIGSHFIKSYQEKWMDRLSIGLGFFLIGLSQGYVRFFTGSMDLAFLGIGRFFFGKLDR